MSDQKYMGDMLKNHKYEESTALEEIFEMQKLFGGKFIPFGDIRRQVEKDHNYSQYSKWIDELILCIADEMSEILNWLPWKHWKDYSTFKLESNELKFEIIDILHFYVNLLQVMGLDSTYIPRPEEQEHVYYTEESRTRVTKVMLLKLNRSLSDLYENKTSVSVLKYINELGYNIKRLFEIWDMDTEEMYNYYKSKNAENWDRQRRGY